MPGNEKEIINMTKKQELEKVKSQNEKLLKRIAEERQKVSGYEEIAKLYSAYIAILLYKLGADSEDKAVKISDDVIKSAIANFETRAFPSDDGIWNLYYCDKGGGDGE